MFRILEWLVSIQVPLFLFSVIYTFMTVYDSSKIILLQMSFCLQRRKAVSNISLQCYSRQRNPSFRPNIEALYPSSIKLNFDPVFH